MDTIPLRDAVRALRDEILAARNDGLDPGSAVRAGSDRNGISGSRPKSSSGAKLRSAFTSLPSRRRSAVAARGLMNGHRR